MTRFAIRPGAIVPRRSATPNISAGVVVKAASAASALSPRRTASRMRDQNSFSGFSSFSAVKAIGMPLSASRAGLLGARSQCWSSSSSVSNACSGRSISGGFGKSSGKMIGVFFSASAFRTRYS